MAYVANSVLTLDVRRFEIGLVVTVLESSCAIELFGNEKPIQILTVPPKERKKDSLEYTIVQPQLTPAINLPCDREKKDSASIHSLTI